MDYDNLRANDGTGPAVLAHIDAPRTIGSTTLVVDSVDNWPANFICTTGSLLPSGLLDPASIQEFTGHLNSGDIIIDAFEPGFADAGNTTDEVAIIKPTGGFANAIADLAEVSHEPDGSFKIPALGTDFLQGWLDANESWSYSSWDSTYKTGVITIPSDGTTKYGLGQRIRISQSTGGTKYGIVTKVAATSLTVYFGTDYTLNNEAISSPFYSVHKAPFGFPLDPTKWTQTTSDTSNRTTSSTSYSNVGTVKLDLPIGAWNVTWQGVMGTNRAATTFTELFIALSTANNSASDTALTIRGYVSGASGAIENKTAFCRNKRIVVTSATPYYQNIMVTSGSMTAGIYGADGATTISALCAYL